MRFNAFKCKLQSWLKISAPLQFCQKMQPFSQKIVAVANVLVLMCSFSFFFALEQHNWYNSTHNPKNALDKIIFVHSSFANCSRSFRFEGWPPNCCFEISPQVVLRDSDLAMSELSSALFVECVLGPAGRPMTSGGDTAFWHWPLHCAPKSLW